MRKLVDAFPDFLKAALEIGRAAALNKPEHTIENVVITGLGGSGIGGTIVSQVVANEATVPFYVNKDYELPAFVGPNTLVIGSSYSGNTEETLAAVQAAQEKGAEIACITSGGTLAEWAKENNWNCILVPGGNPPRSMFPYSFTQLFFVLNHYGLIGEQSIKDLEASHTLVEANRKFIEENALEISKELLDKRVVIYSEASFEGVAIRFRQQLNENSKQLCWHHALPEMNHNELVGWAGGDKGLAVLILRNETDHPRTQVRMDLSKGIYKRYTDTVVEVFSTGNSTIERTMSLILLGDWISIHLAEMNDIDPIEIEVINYLKSELAKVQ